MTPDEMFDSEHTDPELIRDESNPANEPMIINEAPLPEADLEETAPEGETEEEQELDEDELLPPGEKTARAFHSWAADLVGCLVFVVLFFIFVVRIVGVDGSSMVPTLHEQDLILLLSNVFYEPENGDVVVVTKKSYPKPIVKRIIASEGQTVDIDFNTGSVWVDGQLLDEPYINEPTYDRGDTEFPLTVPEGYIFVMGDNRNHSTDSRWSVIGLVDERSVLGKAMFRIFPFTDVGKIE